MTRVGHPGSDALEQLASRHPGHRTADLEAALHACAGRAGDDADRLLVAARGGPHQAGSGSNDAMGEGTTNDR